MVRIGEHYRPLTDAQDAGVYRVVGTPDDVTLLRVADTDGRRAHTGELRHVSPEALAAAFDSADDPDAGLNPAADARNLLSGLYWSFRKFL